MTRRLAIVAVLIALLTSACKTDKSGEAASAGQATTSAVGAPMMRGTWRYQSLAEDGSTPAAVVVADGEDFVLVDDGRQFRGGAVGNSAFSCAGYDYRTDCVVVPRNEESDLHEVRRSYLDPVHDPGPHGYGVIWTGDGQRYRTEVAGFVSECVQPTVQSDIREVCVAAAGGFLTRVRYPKGRYVLISFDAEPDKQLLVVPPDH